MISWVGIDISKLNLVVWVQPQKEGFEIPNRGRFRKRKKSYAKTRRTDVVA